MRKSSPLLEPLFTPIMQGVLASMLLMDREWYLSDLAKHLKVRPSSLQNILAHLTSAGILKRRKNGNRVYYGGDGDCPILGELKAILTKTVGMVEPLRDALAPFAGKIRVALIHGSVAEQREKSGSDIDLIVVGSVTGPDLTLSLRSVQDALGREINTTRYKVEEFENKVKSGHHFLTSILKKPRLFLVGSEDDLDRLIGARKIEGRSDIATGN